MYCSMYIQYTSELVSVIIESIGNTQLICNFRECLLVIVRPSLIKTASKRNE